MIELLFHKQTCFLHKSISYTLITLQTLQICFPLSTLLVSPSPCKSVNLRHFPVQVQYGATIFLTKKDRQDQSGTLSVWLEFLHLGNNTFSDAVPKLWNTL